MIDIHCHFDKEELENIPKILEICKNKKINRIILSGYDKESNKIANELSQKYEMIYGSVGYLPDETTNLCDEDFDKLEEYLNSNKKIVAIGEIGLDYYWEKDNKEEQKELFVKQINIAKKHNLPIIIHSRDAMQDTFDLIKEYKDITKIMHCYSGSLEMARELIKINTYISCNGIITFKNAKNIIEVIKNIDLEYILTETDSPYLTPEPYRGKKNYPYYIPEIVKKISEIKNTEEEKVENIVFNNANRIFDFIN